MTCRTTMLQKSAAWLAVFALGASLAGCGKPQQGGPPPGGGLPVQAYTVEDQDVSESTVYQAQLISRHSVSLQPQVAGQVAAIYVKAGDRVRAGAPLILLDNRKQAATVNASRADAEALKAAIAQSRDTLRTVQVQRAALQSTVTFNRQQLDRYTALLAKDAASRQVVEQYQNTLKRAQSDLDANAAQAQAQRSAVVASQKNYARAVSAINEQAEQLRYFRITAPYAGVVGDIPVRVGSYVLPTTLLLSVTQNNPLEINISLPTDKTFDANAGLPVDVLDNNGKVVGSSHISFVSPRVNTDSQTLLVKAIMENPTEKLKADQSVKVRVTFSKHRGLMIPTGAVSHFGGQDFVFRISHRRNKANGKDEAYVNQVPVTVGDIQGDRYVVLKGLQAGDQIVAAGIQKLGDKAPVTVLPENAGKPGAGPGPGGAPPAAEAGH